MFEKDVAKMGAIVYPTSSDGTTVALKNKDLSVFSIDSLLSKQLRLKVMTEWNFSLFQEKLGKKIQYGIIMGKAFSGKSEVSSMLKKNHGFTVMDTKEVMDAVRLTMGSPEEPFEGEVP